MRYVGIDPSTKTGLVILDEQGEVIHEQEIKPFCERDPERMMEIANTVRYRVEEGDKVIIEGFSYGSRGSGVSVQYGVGWMIRAELTELHGMDWIDRYIEVTPNALKKFATGKGNTKKEDMILPIYKRWGYENDSDNIRDAYILAQIGRYLDGHAEPTKYQKEVLTKIQKGD